MRTPKTISWRFWLSLVPVALILAGIALLVQELKPNAPPESPELVRAKLDSISKDADNVKWLLSTVVLFAGVLTTAQGVLAFFAVQNYVKQADDAMKRVTDAVAKTEKLADEVKSKYPMFADIQAARSAAFDELSHIVPDLDT